MAEVRAVAAPAGLRCAICETSLGDKDYARFRSGEVVCLRGGCLVEQSGRLKGVARYQYKRVHRCCRCGNPFENLSREPEPLVRAYPVQIRHMDFEAGIQFDTPRGWRFICFECLEGALNP